MNLFHQEPKVVRQMIREGKITSPTSGMCAGYAQGNLVVLPKEFAYDFLLFTQRNPKPCPVLEVSDVGSREFSITAKGSDIARDIPKYRVYRDGVMQGEYEDVSSFWRDDLVSFMLGCSFSFEAPMIEEGIEVRHITENCNVLMYITNIPCRPAGIFSGPVVVSMRPIPHEKVVKAVTVTERMPQVHGTPIHIGDPEYIGIRDIHHPDFGDPVTIKEGEIPVFWACGVTPQAVVMNVKPPFVITHAPGHMFITDMKNSQL